MSPRVSYIESPHVRVVEKVRGQVDVGALLFGLDQADVLLRLARRPDHRHGHFVAEEVPVVDGDFREGP